jgi:hypothetical protein
MVESVDRRQKFDWLLDTPGINGVHLAVYPGRGAAGEDLER